MTIDHLRTAIAEQVPRLQSWEVDGLAKKLESLGLVHRWTSVKEAVPDAGWFIGYIDQKDYHAPELVLFDGEMWIGPHGEARVTHWQSVPPTPKDPT